MTINVERLPEGPAVEDLIVLLAKTTRPRTIEFVADQLGVVGDRRAIRPLLMRLCDWHVQEDPDVEDAVCGALVSLGVMCSTGNLSFTLRPPEALVEDAVEAVRELAGVIPGRYYASRRN